MAEIISDRDDFIHKVLCIKPLADKIHEIPRFKKVSEQDVLEMARILIAEIELEKNDFCKADIFNIADEHPEKWGQLKALKKFIKRYTDPPLPQE